MNETYADADPITYATFDDLLSEDAANDAGEALRLPSGALVRVRGLTRHELIFNGKGTDDPLLIEARTISSCLLDPHLTVSQVQTWQRASSAGGDIRVLGETIRNLSGIGEGADKSDPGKPGE